MNTNNENIENEFPEIREKLSKLPRLKASDNFIHNLQLKIDVYEAESKKLNTRTEEIQKSYFKNVFGAGWVMPAAGLAIAAAIIFSIVFWNRTPDNVTTQYSQNNSQVKEENKANTSIGNTLSDQKKTEQKVEDRSLNTDTQKNDMASLDQKSGKTETVNTKSKTVSTPVYTSKTVTTDIASLDLQTNNGKTSNSFVNEEKSSTKMTDSEDAMQRKKLQMSNSKGGDVKANPPTSPAPQQRESISGTANDKAAPIKKSVKDVSDISKTSLESIRAKIK